MKAPCRSWLDDAIRKIEADAAHSADTHLIRLPLSATAGITLYSYCARRRQLAQRTSAHR